MRAAVDPASRGAGGSAETGRVGRAGGAGAGGTSVQGAGRVTPADERVALWLRFVIWVVAIPLGAGIVFGAAEVLGALSSKQLLDTFLDSGLDRFGAVARLLPLWALASAAFVHFSVMAIARWRGRRRRAREARADAGSRQPREEREPARAGS